MRAANNLMGEGPFALTGPSLAAAMPRDDPPARTDRLPPAVMPGAHRQADMRARSRSTWVARGRLGASFQGHSSELDEQTASRPVGAVGTLIRPRINPD